MLFSRTTPFTVGVLNCAKNSESLDEALNLLANQQFVLILNEAKFNGSTTPMNLEIFESMHSSNLHIITNMEGWKLVFSTDQADVVAIKSSRLKESFIIFGCYFNPSLRKTEVKKRMDLIHENMYTVRSHRIIFGGDLNAQSPLWSDTKACDKGGIIMQSLIHNGLTNAIPVDSSTAKANFTSDKLTWIDALCVSKKLTKFIRKPTGVQISASDHPMLMCSISKEAKSKIIVDRKLLQQSCENVDLSFLNQNHSTYDELNNQWERLCDSLLLISTKSRRTIKSNGPSRSVPLHLVKERRKIVKALQRLRQKLLKNDSHATIDRINEYTAKCRSIDKEIKNFRAEEKDKKFESLIKHHGQWAAIKRFMGQHFFNKLSSVNAIKENPQSLCHIEEFHKQYTLSSPCELPSELYEYIDMNIDAESALQFAISKLRRKACHFDANLSCSVLVQLLKTKGLVIVSFIINSISRCFIPAFIKQSRITLIPKAASFKVRPISVLHPLYRLTDCLLFFWIKSRIKINLDYQYAFTDGKSAFHLISTLKRDIDSLPHDLVSILISLDLSDAFECVNFDIIKEGLREAGLSGIEIRVIIELISNRSSYIEINQTKKWKIHTTGTPQGGFISPILFAISTFGLKYLINEFFRIYMYADDIFILSTGQQKDTHIWSLTERRLQILSKMFSLANLKVNSSKSTAMVVMKGIDKSTNTGMSELIKARTLHLNSQPITIGNTMKILGIQFRTKYTTAYGKSIHLFCDNSLLQALTKSGHHLIRYCSRIQRMPLQLVHILLTSILAGCIHYYGPLQRAVSNMSLYEKHLDECMLKIGQIINTCADVKRSTSRLFMYFLFFKTPLFVIIEQTVTRSSIKIESQISHETFPHEIKIPSIYGLSTIAEPKPTWHSNFQPLHTYWGKEHQPHIRYKRASTTNELWFEVSCQIGGQWITSYHRYWSPTKSYIEQLEDALYQALEPLQDSLLKYQLICIETDKPLAKRISSPIYRTRFNILLGNLDKTIVFVERCTQTFKIIGALWKTIPLMVIYPSDNYFKLIESSMHLKYSKRPNINLAESALHRYKYRSIKWELMSRVGLFGLTLLTGGWRSRNFETITCPTCAANFNTKTIFTNPCSHLPPFPKNDVIIDDNYLYHSFSSLSRITSLSRHLYSCLKVCGF